MSEIPEAAQALHANCVVIDGHCDTLLHQLETNQRLGGSGGSGQIDLDRLQKGGVTTQVFAIWVSEQFTFGGAARRALRLFDLFWSEQAQESERFRPILKTEDILAAKAAGQVGGILGLEGVDPLEGSTALLRMYHRLGLRVLGLTWNGRNLAADGVAEARSQGGLTNFGLDVVRECNRLGIVLDISHLAPAGVEDVLATSEQPIIASHTAAKALCNHRRDLTDEQIRAVAQAGGVVGVTFVRSFLSERQDTVSLQTVIDHIAHIAHVGGIEAVGIGSDFDGLITAPPDGLEDVAQMPALTAALLARGFSPADVRKILGENLLRVFQQVMG